MPGVTEKPELYTRQRELQRPPERSIFDFYSIPNEVTFLRRAQAIPEKEKKFYVEKNIYRFLDEFVGKVPYTKISYVHKEGGLFFADIDAMRAYRETAEMTPEGSREWAEYVGMNKVLDSLNDPAVQTVVEVSPPKIADYGLLFLFQKGKQGTVDEYILRYNEPLGQTNTSRQIVNALSPQQNTDNFHGANDFIMSPVTFSSKDTLQHVLSLPQLGISNERIRDSMQFEENVRPEVSGYIDQYSNIVLRLSEMDTHHPRRKELEQRAQILLTVIYNIAEEIRDTIKEPGANVPTSFRRAFSTEAEHMRYYFYKKPEPVITGGGSCPVVVSEKSEFLSSHTIRELLSNGKRAENALHFVCPECGVEATGPIGDTCPSCGLTKEQYAKKGWQVC